MCRGFHKANSSDLDMGRCPELKSDEFSLWNPLHVEISKCEDSFTVNKVLHLFGASVPDGPCDLR